MIASKAGPCLHGLRSKTTTDVGAFLAFRNFNFTDHKRTRLDQFNTGHTFSYENEIVVKKKRNLKQNRLL